MADVSSPVVSFSFSGRAYKARFLRATKPNETSAIVFGLGLNPKLDRVHVIFESSATGSDEAWWCAAGRLSPLARAALVALGKSA